MPTPVVALEQLRSRHTFALLLVLLVGALGIYTRHITNVLNGRAILLLTGIGALLLLMAFPTITKEKIEK